MTGLRKYLKIAMEHRLCDTLLPGHTAPSGEAATPMSTAPTPGRIPLPPTLSEADSAQLSDLYVRGTPEATLHAYERDLIYITAWKQASFGLDLTWPESEAVALRFVLDHGRDLSEVEDAARGTAETLIAMGLRRKLTAPAPSCASPCSRRRRPPAARPRA